MNYLYLSLIIQSQLLKLLCIKPSSFKLLMQINCNFLAASLKFNVIKTKVFIYKFVCTRDLHQQKNKIILCILQNNLSLNNYELLK